MASPNNNTTGDAVQSNESDNEKSVKMCPELKEFYTRHGVVDAEDLLDANGPSAASSLRFIRLNPRYDKEETLRLLEAELDGGKCLPAPWIDDLLGFYAIPGNFSLAQSKVYQSGRIYGMDVSSGAAAAALLLGIPVTASNARVLDLCCSPGLKLCTIADYLVSSATVVGVDVSEERLAVCKRIVKKYHVDPATSGFSPNKNGPRIRLYCADGTTFGSEPDPTLVFDSVAAIEDQQVAGKRKRMNKSARARERKRLRQLSSLDKKSTTGVSHDNESKLTIEPFDYVLVDAECSTDGSLKHVQQRAKKAGKGELATNETLTDPNKLESLVELQKGLISSGFKLLKQDGYLVYSTCSLSTDQNERVVEWLLENYSDAYIIPLKFPFGENKLIAEGSLEGTVRFLPGVHAISGTEQAPSLFGGGFFLAKLGRRRPVQKRFHGML